jgi:hypothetical protein
MAVFISVRNETKEMLEHKYQTFSLSFSNGKRRYVLLPQPSLLPDSTDSDNISINHCIERHSFQSEYPSME